MGGGNTKFRFIAEHGMVAFYRTNGPLTYALSGEMPRDDLLHLAQIVHDDLVSVPVNRAPRCMTSANRLRFS